MNGKKSWSVLVLAGALSLAACSDDDGNTLSQTTGPGAGGSGGMGTGAAGGNDGGAGGQGGGATDNIYAFDSKFVPGTSPVAYTGQAYRQVLIETQKNDIAAMSVQIDGDTYNPADAAAAFARINFYYAHDGSTAEDVPLGITTTPAALQTTYGDYSSTATLDDKLAGNDTSTDHKDWSSAFVGWSDPSIEGTHGADGADVDTPEGLLLAFMWTLADQAYQRSIDDVPNEPGTSTPIGVAYVTPSGLDLRQLIQKFLLMGVTYSQASDDYLERDTTQPTKGLLAPNAQDGDNPFSTLGHHWDEGFGYFGAARDYARYTDDEIAASGDGRADWQLYHDSNDDGALDLMQEHNWGASTNAAKRDRGATDTTDLTLDAISAFYQGRALILAAGDTLTAGELDQLEMHALAAIGAWEQAIAATIVHYINDTIADTEAIDGSGYSFTSHATHWSEMKGFALGMQFNPNKKLTDQQFLDLHALIGDAPVLATATMQDRLDYIVDLQAARTIVMNAYDFTQNNVENW